MATEAGLPVKKAESLKVNEEAADIQQGEEPGASKLDATLFAADSYEDLSNELIVKNIDGECSSRIQSSSESHDHVEVGEPGDVFEKAGSPKESILGIKESNEEDIYGFRWKFLRQIEVRKQRAETVSEVHRDSISEDVNDPEWARHKKHIFILSEAGKPIYSRYGNEEKLVTLMGVMQALVSFVQDNDDNIRVIIAGKHKFMFLVRGPLILVAVCYANDSPAQEMSIPDLVQMYSFLFGNPPGTGDEVFTHPAGNFVYPFTFTLPQNLPSSFEARLGHVRYYLKATIDKPWKFDHDVKIPVTINELIDTNHPSYLSQPNPKGNATKEVGCCCPSGTVTVEAAIDRTAYCPGESIIINAQALNQSRTDMTALKAKIYQTIEYHARSKTKRDYKTISTIQSGELLRGQNVEFVNQPLNIPPTPPSILNSSVIKVLYIVQIYIDVPCGFDLELKLPTIIGTIPFRGNPIPPMPVGSVPTAPMLEVQPAPDPSVPPQNGPWTPDAPPPSYEAVCGDQPVNISDANDSQYVRGNLSYMPVYPYVKPSS